MKIIADRHIPLVREAFSTLGEVRLVDGAAISRADLRDAGLLVVRTVTRVDQSLLDGTSVTLVASATSGIDHVDSEYLARRGIGLVSAAGCNARPVAEYVLSALYVAFEQRELPLEAARVGIIGCGNAGSMVHGMLRALGVHCVLNDPPLAAAGARADLRPLEEMMDADAISLHVPLTREGSCPTLGMISASFLDKLRPEAVLINTSRGEVMDEAALCRHLERRGTAVLDVWSGEPEINLELLRRTLIATPHIAGYSHNAKWRATDRVYRAACAALRVEAAWRPPSQTDFPRELLRLDASLSDEDAVRAAVLAAYDVRGDSVELKSLQQVAEAERAAYFRAARNDYVPRAEFTDRGVEIAEGRTALAGRLAALGFHVAASRGTAGQSATS